jgi:hypothetical protein
MSARYLIIDFIPVHAIPRMQWISSDKHIFVITDRNKITVEYRPA